MCGLVLQGCSNYVRGSMLRDAPLVWGPMVGGCPSSVWPYASLMPHQCGAFCRGDALMVFGHAWALASRCVGPKCGRALDVCAGACKGEEMCGHVLQGFNGHVQAHDWDVAHKGGEGGHENAFPAVPAAPAARQKPNPAQTLTSKMTSLTSCSR